MALATEMERPRRTDGDDQSPVRIKSEPTVESDDHLRHLLERPSAEAADERRAPPVQVAPLRPLPTTGGQRTIDSYFDSVKGRVGAAPKAPPDKEEGDKGETTPSIDLESIRGIFGWTTLEGVHVPFILRQEDKFTAVRIIEKSLLKKYLQALPTDVYSCTYIKSYFITDNEAKLLNEINMKHCDRQFGHELFTTKDLVVQLSDVEQLYEFLATCYYKLIRPSQGHGKEARCGIIKVDGSVVPYIRRNGTKYVPLSSFDRESAKALEMKTEKLEPWEVSYVKFCCKVAGIGHEFLKQDSCPVVSIDDLRQTLSASSRFEEWWPSSHVHFTSPNRDSARSGASSVPRWSVGGPAATTAARDVVDADKNGFQSPYPLPRATYFDKGIAPALHNLYACAAANSDRELVAPLLPMVASPRVVASELPGDGDRPENGLVDDGAAVDPAARLSYPIPTLSRAPFPLATGAIAAPNPQAFIYNHGQWWGSLGPRSLDGRYCPPGVAHCQSLAAHCPRGPTQCSPGAARMPYTSSVLAGGPEAPLPLSRYPPNASPSGREAQLAPSSGLDGDVVPRADRTSERRPSSDLRASGRSSREVGQQSHPSRPQVPSLIRTTVADAAGRRTSNCRSSPGADGQFHSVLPKALPPPSVCDVLSRTSDIVIGNATAPRQSDVLPKSLASSSGSFLARHLLDCDVSAERHHGHPLEKNVVAPGNLQSLAGKMSSPKPGNQVPTTVTGDGAHRLPPVGIDGVTGTIPNLIPPPAHLGGLVSPLLNLPNGQILFNSKLQELLNHSEASIHKTSSRSTAVRDHSSSARLQKLPRYRLQSVLLSGTKFRAINSVEYEYHSGLMVPVVELSAKIKPRTSSQTFKHILSDVFGLRLFECNRGQEELLKAHLESFSGSCRTALICIEDLMKYLPQLSYTVAKLRIQENQPVAKRARVETVVSS